MVSFWGLNAGLMGMIVVTLVPIGVMQALESFQNGFWSARSLSFYQQPLVKTLLWIRMVPDSVFIGLGVLPLVAASVYGLFHLRGLRAPAPVQPKQEEEVRELVGV
jgi:nitric oxide reductase subunit B